MRRPPDVLSGVGVGDLPVPQATSGAGGVGTEVTDTTRLYSSGSGIVVCYHYTLH